MPARIDKSARWSATPRAEAIFGCTAAMRAIREKIELAAQDSLPLLIEGESGTGKEVIGRFLHQSSSRRDKAFVKLNCGAGLPNLLKGEISGFEPATFADSDGNSSISLVSGGTLFLDGIDGLDSSAQVNLARILESGRHSRMDGREDRVVNARFVCATSIDQGQNLRGGVLDEFLGCFAHRVCLPPLRERREDIPQLCEYLMRKLALDFGRPVPHLSFDAVAALQGWEWPGNIRELENWIARIVIFGAEDVVGIELRRQVTAGKSESFVPEHRRNSHTRYPRGRRPQTH